MLAIDLRSTGRAACSSTPEFAGARPAQPLPCAQPRYSLAAWLRAPMRSVRQVRPSPPRRDRPPRSPLAAPSKSRQSERARPPASGRGEWRRGKPMRARRHRPAPRRACSSNFLKMRNAEDTSARDAPKSSAVESSATWRGRGVVARARDGTSGVCPHLPLHEQPRRARDSRKEREQPDAKGSEDEPALLIHPFDNLAHRAVLPAQRLAAAPHAHERDNLSQTKASPLQPPSPPPLGARVGPPILRRHWPRYTGWRRGAGGPWRVG